MTGQATEVERRLEAVEIKLAYSEDLIQQLNDALSGQQLQFEQLKRAMKLLTERLSEVPEGSQGAAAWPDERPPHY